MTRINGLSSLAIFPGLGRILIVSALLAAGSLLAQTARAAMVDLTGGVWQTTPPQVPGDVVAGNDVITSSVGFWDNATITTNTAVILTFYYVGAESGYTNTLNVTGGGTHDDESIYPGSWSNSPLWQIQLGADEEVPLFFTSTGPNFPLGPGDGNPLGLGFDRSIGFAILSCTTGDPACFSADQNLRSGNIIAFMLDDGGAGPNDNHDDYVGYLIATPVPVPLPAAAWLLISGLGALGIARRRKA